MKATPGHRAPKSLWNVLTLLFSIVAVFLSSPPSAAQEVQPVIPERVDDFIELVAKNECRLSNQAGEIYLPAGGFADKDEVRAIMARLFYYGRARLIETDNDGVLVLYDGPCPEGGEHSDPRTLFLRIVASNQCALSMAEGRQMIRQAGLLKQEISTMLPLMVNDGTLSLSADGQTVFLTDEACNDYGPSPELVTDLVHDPITQPREALIEYLEATGCELTYEEAQTALPGAGFDFNMIDELVQDYLAEGIVRIGPNDTLILTIGAWA